jgi:hypothetical protein
MGPARDARSARQLLLLALITTIVLVLFSDKAFTIDDPLFLWLAKQIVAHPLDFFGFDVNWYGSKEPMGQVTMNPPLAGYYLALAGSLFGWSERALHLALVIPAVVAIGATWALAARLCSRPLEAAAIALFTPAFLVSSTNIMCDTLMLAFWSVALWLWLEGISRDEGRWLLAAAACASLAGLTKFFGLALIPLMLAHGLMVHRRLGPWASYLLLPVLTMAGYECITFALYGSGHILQATAYATGSKSSEEVELSLAMRGFVGLVFAGGCLAPAILYATLLWGSRALFAAYGLLILTVVLPEQTLDLLGVVVESSEVASLYTAQLSFLAVAGLSVVGLACVDLKQERNAESALLFLWVVGTLFFATFLNWTNNGRSNLPIAPAVGILIARRLDHQRSRTNAPAVLHRAIAFSISASLALLVAHADYRWANGVRESAALLAREYAHGSRPAYFLGHWGFQYYMEAEGAKPLDTDHDFIEPGQRLVIPQNNTAVFPDPPEHAARQIAEHNAPAPGLIRTMSPGVGAGFYSSKTGILPFVLIASPGDRYEVVEMRRRTKIKFE